MAGEIASAYVALFPKLEAKSVVSEITKGTSGAGTKLGQQVSSEASKAASSGMKSAGQAAGNSFADGFSAAKIAIGNIIAQLAMSAANEFKEKFGDGVEQSDALQKFFSTMEFAGFEDSQIASVQSAMKAYADETVYDLDEVMNTTAKLAANGTKDFDTLVQGIGNLNAAAGGNSESFGYLANAITQVNGAGVLMSQDWNQIVNALPGASGAIQKELEEMGAWDSSMGSFKDALANGQISAEQFNQAITNLGMTDIAQEAATSSTTFEGAMGQLDASVTNTMQGIYDNLNENDRITNAINSMATAFETISPYIETFANAFGDVVEFVSPALPIIAGVVAGFAGASIITTIIGAISGAVAAFTAVVGPAIAAAGLIPGVVGVITAVLGGPITIIMAIIGAVVAFLATNEEARAKVVEVFTAIKDTITEKIKSAADTLKRIWMAIKTTITVVWNAIKTTITTTINNVKTTITSKFNALKTFLGTVFSGIKEKLTKPFTDAKDAINGIIAKIKGFFPFNIGKILNLKLPHISVSGGKAPWGIMGKGSLPKFSVNWYAQGGIFNTPSIIGVGEAGSEAVVPLEKLRYYIRDSVPQTAGAELVDEVRALRSDVQNMKVVLDSGALVGGISKRMDGSLGRRQQLAGRGVA